ncbi:unnamed protein product [Adineta steineri]|uniref:Uncharacterized protein n=1 Tax=Adineta steineri TaxID=433720 RepID=A0A815CQ01_9BILA|nr:unnamed protein product [Adineta steineri]CAF1567315.1 unnamed protein product [Adineta steineri]
MAMIAFICLLALSSSAFGRYADSYGSAPLTRTTVMRDLPIQSNYGSSFETVQRDIQLTPTTPIEKPISSGYDSYSAPRKMIVPQQEQSYGKQVFQSRVFPTQSELLAQQNDLLKAKIAESTMPTEADNLCRGQIADTVIPLDGGRRFIVCLGESKGYEQFCPKGLLYHPEQRRCERKLGPLENFCSSSPCLNNGQCIPTDGSFKCQCATGFDGRICELDATVCHTQQPCGTSFDAKCQSFRWEAALTHMCILQGGRSYGLTSSQVHPSPCKGTDGTFPLAFSDKGFIMCDGDSMFVESCPGGTLWDDINKSCVWPDLVGVIGASFDETPKMTSSYGSSYSTPSFEQPKMTSSYGSSYSTPSLEQPKLFRDVQVKSSYGAPLQQKTVFLQDETPVTNYGSKTEFTFPQQDRIETPVQSYSSYSAPQMIKPKSFLPIRQQEQRVQSNGY